jgi:hypothetical protein
MVRKVASFAESRDAKESGCRDSWERMRETMENRRHACTLLRVSFGDEDIFGRVLGDGERTETLHPALDTVVSFFPFVFPLRPFTTVFGLQEMLL